MKSASTFPVLKTERLVLRPFALSDAKDVQRLAGNKNVAATAGTIPHPYLDGVAEEWIAKHQELFEKNVSVTWAVTFNNELVGCVSLIISKAHNRAEIGYWVAEDSWNKGYCSEASKAAVQYGFEKLNLIKVTSRHMSDNPGSGKVMIKIGMEKEGYLKKELLKNGAYKDMVVYGLLKENFK